MILLGDEYYVREIDGATKIYLSKGRVLDGISSEGYAAEYNGYKFKIDHLIYSAEYEVEGILLDVETPNGTIVQTKVNETINGKVDDLEIMGIYAEEADALASASILVYDTTTDAVLEDGEDLKLEEQLWADWEVTLHVVDDCVNADTDPEYDPDGPECNITEYNEMDSATTDALLQEIEITYRHRLDDHEALEEGELFEFPGEKISLKFKGYTNENYLEGTCSGGGDGNIQIEQGDENYQIKISFTGEDGNRYDDVRLDEGPFGMGDEFILNGTVYEYSKYTELSNGVGKGDDQVEIVLSSPIQGGNSTIVLDRFCDPNDWQAIDCNMTNLTLGPDCNCQGLPDEITFRALALTDAIDDRESTRYENDRDVDLDDTYDLFYKNNAINNLTVFYDDLGRVTLADDLTDIYLTLNPNMVGVLDDFEVNEHKLWLWVKEEGDKYRDINSFQDNTYTQDLNNDADDDDTLIMIMDDNSEAAIIDLCDRDYDEYITWDYDNAVGMYKGQCNCTLDCQIDACNFTEVISLDEDKDTQLIAPRGGNTYTIDWGTDNTIEEVEVCHQIDNVKPTLFVGTTEIEGYTLTGDLDSDGKVELWEVIDMISLWIQEQATLSEVIEAISNWVM